MSYTNQYPNRLVVYPATYLTIIESSLNCEIVYVGVEHRRHLGFLYWAHLTCRMHYENRDILLTSQPVDGSRSRITARCSNHSQVLPAAQMLLALISSHEEILKEVSKKLQRYILESKRRAVEELEQVEVFALVKRNDWSNIRSTERLVTVPNDVLQVAGRDLLRRDIQREDSQRQLLERIIAPFRPPVSGQ